MQPVEAASVKALSVIAATGIEAAAATPESCAQEQLLIQAGGATVDEVMKSTGWQQLGVRGLFAGTVRKKLGFELTSDKQEGEERRYAIKVAA